MERNLGIDYFRLILSIFVITVHTQPLFDDNSLAGWLISNGIARIAVPCFFIISGYFLHQKLDDKKALKKHLLHILIVYAVWSIIYLPTYIGTIEPRSLITFALMGYYHLWFLPALIIGILMLAGIRKLITNNKLILLSGILFFAIGSIMEYYQLPQRSYCNGIFFGYPFVALGYVIQARNWKDNYNSTLLYSLLIISAGLLIQQCYTNYIFDTYNEMLSALYVFCPMLFVIVLRRSHYVENKGYIAKLSSGIYLTHILVLTLIVPLSDVNNIIKLPLIIIVSILLSIFIIFLNKRIKILL